MTVFTEIVFTVKSPFLVDRSIIVQVGAIDEDGILHHITLDPFLTVTPITTDSTIQFAQEALVILPSAEGTVAYLLNYEGVETVLSFFATPGIIIPTQQILQKTIFNILPPLCYTQVLTSAVTAKLAGMAAVYLNLYTDLQTVLFNFFPPFTDNIEWGTMLNDYYSWQGSFDFGLVVQLFNNIPLANGNVFDTTLILSQYIFARFGLEVYVYIQENVVNNLQEWVLGESILGDSTILNANALQVQTVCVFVQTAVLSDNILNELTLFSLKLFPATIQVTVEAEPDFSKFGLLVEVGDVYVLDPRLFVPFALKYDSVAVFNAVGLCSPFNPFFAIALDYDPPGGTFQELPPTIDLTATATYDFEGNLYFGDVTADTVFTSDNVNVLTVTDNTLNIQMAGAANIEASWEQFTTSHLFTITAIDVWVIGTSDLGANTILIS